MSPRSRFLLVAAAAAAATAGVILMVQVRLRSLAGLGLEDRVCLVATDLEVPGLAVARHLLWRGARVALLAAGDLEPARELLGEGRDVVVLGCDARDQDSVEAMLEEVTRRLGPVDVLIWQGEQGLIERAVDPGVLVRPLPADPDIERGARRLADSLEEGRGGAGPAPFRQPRPSL